MRALLLTLWLACGTLHAAMTGNYGWDYEAHNWRSNVFKLSAGGSLGSAGYQNGTLFMQNIKRWDVRRYLGRVNMYLGNDTNAMSVCLIQDWWFGTQTNDTLVNFVAADYSETNGLTGNTTTKHISLNGGVFPSGTGASDATNYHMAAYVRSGIGGTAGHIAGEVSALGYFIMNVRDSSDITTALLDSGQPTASDTNGMGFYVSTRGSATLAHVYRNGTVFITDSTAMASSVFPSSVNGVAHAINNTGTVGSYSSKTLSYYARGAAIPPNREVAYNLAVQYSQKLAQRKIGP